METELVSNKKQLQHINTLIKQQTYLFPRLHLSTQMLVKELFVDAKFAGKHLVQFLKEILEDAIFNDEIHNSMKSVAKMKYLHIGFKIAELVLQEVNKMKTESLDILVVRSLLLKFSNFKSLLVRNVQMPKN